VTSLLCTTMFSDGLDSIFKNEDRYSPLRRRYTQSPSLPFFLLSTVYHALRDVPIPSTPSPPSDPSKIRLVCMSDTHTHLLPPSEIPPGDILIHAGDLTHSGSAEELGKSLDWLRTLPHPHKVFIGETTTRGWHTTTYARRSTSLVVALPTWTTKPSTSLYADGLSGCMGARGRRSTGTLHSSTRELGLLQRSCGRGSSPASMCSLRMGRRGGMWMALGCMAATPSWMRCGG